MRVGAATSGNFVGLLRSIGAVQLDRHPPFHSRPPVFQAPKLAPSCLGRSQVNRGGVVETARLSTDAVRQILLKRAGKAGLKGSLVEPFSPHGLRAGFVTTAYRNGVPDEEIMGHTRHRSLTTMRSYVRRAKLSRESPAGKLGL
jgi:integrase